MKSYPPSISLTTPSTRRSWSRVRFSSTHRASKIEKWPNPDLNLWNCFWTLMASSMQMRTSTWTCLQSHKSAIPRDMHCIKNSLKMNSEMSSGALWRTFCSPHSRGAITKTHSWAWHRHGCCSTKTNGTQMPNRRWSIYCASARSWCLKTKS